MTEATNKMMEVTKKKILWVDDDAAFIDAHMKEVGQYYDVVVARDADQFWKIINQNGDQFCGVVMDIMLPFGASVQNEDADGGLRTGIALMEQMKASTKFRLLPVVIFTIRWSADVDEFAEKHGIKVIRKQDSLDDLVNAVRNAFG